MGFGETARDSAKRDSGLRGLKFVKVMTDIHNMSRV